MATMVSVAVVSIRAGQGSARIKGATRDVMASIRHARSMALVMMQPAVVTYSTVSDGDGVCAQIEVEGARLTAGVDAKDVVQTLSGEPICRDGTPVGEEGEATALGEGGGQTVEDVLFAPLSREVVHGVRVKVTKGDERLEFEREESRSANRISVFSNVDYLLGKYRAAKSAETKKDEPAADESADPPAAAAKAEEDQPPVSVVWEANGRCEAHRVWVYLDGSTPDKGLCIKVDRFGAAKVVSFDDSEG